MKTVAIPISALILMTGPTYAENKMTKTPSGFEFPSSITHTYYTNRVVWGDTYADHVGGAPLVGVKVKAFSDGWEYVTFTGEDGSFTVEVLPGVPFKISISDDDRNVQYSELLASIAEGTTFDDRTP